MKNLFDPAQVADVRARLDRLEPTSPRLWGTMTPAQVLAHCAVGFETASGASRPPRAMIGRLLGGIIKPFALKDDEPMRKNSPTAAVFLIKGDRDFDTERARLRQLLDHFAAAGAAGCTDHPHAFFGRLTGDEWAILMYKHMDHHLRQFGQ
ncbi:MAG TPA: DUF1569 domain-containing protein [Gemmatimonadales bacterium]|jgi:hypothetical protein